MLKDRIVEEVRRIREQMAEEAGYSARKFFKMIKDSQKRSGRKFIRLHPKRLAATPHRAR